MKTRITRLLNFTSVCLGLSVLPLAAQGPGRGPGGGGGGFQEAIHTLFENHEKITRTVELTETGYRARTVSDDPEIASTLQKHVREMRKRLGAGMMIRRWDPAFAELVEHYKEIDHDFKEVKGGVEMIATGKTPDAVKVTQNHAKIISGFVKEGPSQMHESHPGALNGGPKEDADKAEPQAHAPEGVEASSKGGCPMCKAATLEKSEAKKGCPECAREAEPKSEPKADATAVEEKEVPKP